MNKLSSMIAIFFITVILIGCATMQGQWEVAAKEDTIAAYSRFLRNADPDAEYKHKAETRIKEIEAAKREKEETAAFEYARQVQPLKHYEDAPISALNSYLSEYPTGKHAPEARKMLENREYEQALKKNQWYAYDAFIAKYPNSDLVPDASARARKLLYDETRKSESVKHYEYFIRRYPQGQDTRELENSMEKIRQLEKSRKLAQELGEVALRMAPVITVPTKRMPNGLIVQSIGIAKVGSPSDLNYQMAKFRKLLEAGADPNLICIDGFYPAHINGPGSFGPGNPGTVVPSNSGNNGNTLIEYFRIINLKEASDLLKKHGGK